MSNLVHYGAVFFYGHYAFELDSVHMNWEESCESTSIEVYVHNEGWLQSLGSLSYMASDPSNLIPDINNHVEMLSVLMEDGQFDDVFLKYASRAMVWASIAVLDTNAFRIGARIHTQFWSNAICRHHSGDWEQIDPADPMCDFCYHQHRPGGQCFGELDYVEEVEEGEVYAFVEFDSDGSNPAIAGRPKYKPSD